MNNKRLPLVALVTAILASSVANAAALPPPKPYGLNHPFKITDLPTGELRKSLQDLPAANVARQWRTCTLLTLRSWI